MMTNIFCGIIAGVVSSAIANPTDVLKVRMQACSTSLQQKSMFECFGDVYRQEGISGLWRVCECISLRYFYFFANGKRKLILMSQGCRSDSTEGSGDNSC